MATNNAWNSQLPAQVSVGGTGASSFIPYAIICGGTTVTGVLQSIASVGTSGQVLTSNGAGLLPTFQTISASILTTANTDSGSATPAANALTFAGGSNMNTSGAGSTVTINLNNSPSVSGSVTAATGLTATTGGITATGNSTINSSGTGTNAIGTGTNSGTISIGNTNSGAVSIDCGTAGISVGTTANAHTTTIGSTNSTSTTTIQSGSNSLTLTTNGGNANIVLTPNGTGVVTTANDLRSASISFDGGTNKLAEYLKITSFTPVLAFGGGSTGIAYSTQSGTYTRIGNIVHFAVTIALTSKGSSTGNASVSLPVSVSASSNDPTLFMCVSDITYTGTLCAFASAGGPAAEICSTTSGIGLLQLTNTAFSNTTTLYLTGIYEA